MTNAYITSAISALDLGFTVPPVISTSESPWTSWTPVQRESLMARLERLYGLSLRFCTRVEFLPDGGAQFTLLCREGGATHRISSCVVHRVLGLRPCEIPGFTSRQRDEICTVTVTRPSPLSPRRCQ